MATAEKLFDPAEHYKPGSKALSPDGCDDCGLNYCHCLKDRPSPAALELPRMLVLSTSHVRLTTHNNFEMQTDDVPTFYPKTYPDGEEMGWLIPLVAGQPWSHMVSDDLVGIRQLAEAAGATWIMLDRDGDVVPSLPTYEW